MATYSNKVLKGDELYYYTTKIRLKLKEIEDAASASQGSIQGAIDELSDTVANNKTETDAAIADLAQQHQDDIEALEDKINDLKFELKPMAGILYSEYYYNGNTYEEYGQARAAAIAAGIPEEEVDNYITHSSEIRALLTSLDPIEIEEEPSSKYLYLVPVGSGDPATSTDLPNNYNEYIWTEESGYELIGSTAIDLDELSDSDIEDIWNSV